MPTMKTMQLGHTGAEVSSLCFGAMRCGTLNDETQSYELLDMFVEAGGNFLDTANCYSKWYPGGKGGDSEPVLGRWMTERGNREDMFIATKVGVDYQDVPMSLSADVIIQECDRSLERLGIDRIDLYYAHLDDRRTPLSETIEAFGKLIESGKVRYIGASNYRAWRLAEAEAISRASGVEAFCCVQQRYSYLRPIPGAGFGLQVNVNEDLLDFCSERGITLLPYSPLLGGAYVRADKPVAAQYVGPDTDARMAALQAVAGETGTTVNQVILAWMLHHDQSVLPVFSASTPEQMRENLGAVDVSLSGEQMSRLNEASGLVDA